MAARWQKRRLTIGPNGGRAKYRTSPCAALYFVALIVVTAGLSLWIENRYHRAETAYRLYTAQHPLKPGEKPPKIDWLTGKVWH